MSTLTSRERIAGILKRQPVDRIGLFESFWGETDAKWRAEGHLGPDEQPGDHFNFDLWQCGAFNVTADLDFEEEVVEETDETRLMRDGNGALLRRWKNKSGTPEHVDFLVKDRAGWGEHIRPHLVNADDHRRRVNPKGHRDFVEKCRREQKFHFLSFVGVMECIHPMCGHENMLIGMALDPDWVRDMCNVYTELTINLMEILFAEEDDPDGIFYYEDMGFKDRPFMSPTMYREIVFPAHKRLFDYAHSRDLPVIVHSCGFVDPLLPGLIEAGMDCLQAMEVKAGMDLVDLKRRYGDQIAFFGGMDIRTLVTNDLDAVSAELEKKLPAVMAGSGYILMSDHSIPQQVEYDTYRFFVRRGLEMGTYK